MSKRLMGIGMVFALLLSPMAMQGDEISDATSAVTDKAVKALAYIEFEIQNDLQAARVPGTAICIVKDGTLVTTALPPLTAPESIQGITIRVPGSGDEFEGELMGIDRRTGLAFVKASGDNDWDVIQFVAKSNLSPGDPVISVGLLNEAFGYRPFAGIGRVSSELRMPGRQVRVTSGALTTRGSPVFNVAGRAIGLVSEQFFQTQEMRFPRRRGTLPVQIRSREETQYFTPVEEFALSLSGRLPKDGQVIRQSWIGVVDFVPFTEKQAKTFKVDKPAVIVGKVVEGTPADKAGLKEADIILAMNGKDLEEFATPRLTAQHFQRTLARMSAGETVELKIGQGLTKKTINVTLEKTPKFIQEAETYVSRELGMAMRNRVMLDKYLSPDTIAKTEGVVLMAVGRGSPAAQAGLQGGDVVTAVNGQKVTTVGQVKDIVTRAVAADPTDPVVFERRRGSQTETANVMPPVGGGR